MTPEQIIEMRNIEKSAQSNIRQLWQDTSDFTYPYVQITSKFEDGSRRTRQIYDMTPMLDAEDMVANLKHILFPAGQVFFAIKVGNTTTLPDPIQRYISMLTEAAHAHIFNSNFITELDDVLRSLIHFGPASIFSEWTPKTGLNYRNAVIGTYQLIENSKKLVDGIIITVEYNPRQAIEEFGDKAGPEIIEANNDPKKVNSKFEFIYIIKPREVVNPNLSPNLNTNMAWEEQVVNVKEKIIVLESGYPDFPYHTARWMRPANEKDGRGISTEILPQIKVLQRMNRDFNEVGNKWANPARETLSSFEGPYRTFPGANNVVRELPSSRAIDQGLNGNFNITEASLDRQTKIIDRAYFKNAFNPIEDLTGDRRTTLEIRERVRGTWPKIGTPVSRIWYEQIAPLVERSILLLIRNGAVPPPPPELEGANFGLDFVGPFALELRSQQSKAFQEWAFAVGELEKVFPGATDNVDSDDAILRLGRTLGVNTEDMASEEQRQAKRDARALKEKQVLELQQMQAGGQAYQSATKAPEEGSPAAELMGV
jgi:hypothetical protein